MGKLTLLPGYFTMTQIWAISAVACLFVYEAFMLCSTKGKIAYKGYGHFTEIPVTFIID